jgi:hypothetical protein
MTMNEELHRLAWLVEETAEHVSVKLNPRRVVVRLVHRPTGVMVTEHGLASDAEARLSAYHSLRRLLEMAEG